VGVDDLPKETLIDGRYEIRERLGSGGMGTVYRAFDNKVGGMVALKLLREGRSRAGMSKEDRQKRFAREILALNQVDHPNVVRIEDFGFYKGALYMVMQLLAGKDLATLLYENGGPFAIAHAVDIVVSICVVIRACHEAKVIHRDLKPANVMIVKRDVGLGWEGKIVDFGIAKLDTSDDLTQEGRIVGTPGYLAPEQIADKPGPASDQYAIGVLLYLCLTGVHPFADFSGLPLIRAIEKGVFKNPREHRADLSPELASIVCKAMHLDPTQRYESVFELGRALRPYCSELGQQLWKNYYDTPPVRGRKIDAKASAVGIPLIRHIAEHGAAPSGAQTVQAHYQSTTAGDGGTVVDAAAPEPRRETAVESKPVTEAVQTSSATAVDVTLPSRGLPDPGRLGRSDDHLPRRVKSGTHSSEIHPVTNATRADSSGHSGLTSTKSRAPRVVITIGLAAILVGAGAWFFERSALRFRASVPEAEVVRQASEAAPPIPSPSPAVAPSVSTAASSTPSAAPTAQGGPIDVADVNRAEAHQADQTKTRGAHHHHREAAAEGGHAVEPDDGKTATELVADADAAFARSDWEAAIAFGRRAIKKNGGDQAYLVTGDASFKAGDFATARAMYGEVLRKNPGSDMVRRRLELVAGKEKQASNPRP
jgi:serine/threonine protein kinase